MYNYNLLSFLLSFTLCLLRFPNLVSKLNSFEGKWLFERRFCRLKLLSFLFQLNFKWFSFASCTKEILVHHISLSLSLSYTHNCYTYYSSVYFLNTYSYTLFVSLLYTQLLYLFLLCTFPIHLLLYSLCLSLLHTITIPNTPVCVTPSLTLLSHSLSAWPDVGIQSSPNFPAIPQKTSHINS